MELSQEDWRISRKCWRKSWFPTMSRAHRRIRQIKKDSGVQLYGYWCAWCGGVHLTKSSDAKGKTL